MLSHILLKLYILQYHCMSSIEEKKRRGDKLPDLRHGIACIFQQKKSMMRIMIMIDQYMYCFYLILTKFFKSYFF